MGWQPPVYHGYKNTIPVIQGVAYQGHGHMHNPRELHLGSGQLPDGRWYDAAGNVSDGTTLPGSSAAHNQNGNGQQKEENKGLGASIAKLYGFVITPLAMGVGYYRTRSLWKSFLLGGVALPYLIYVGIDSVGKKEKV